MCYHKRDSGVEFDEDDDIRANFRRIVHSKRRGLSALFFSKKQSLIFRKRRGVAAADGERGTSRDLSLYRDRLNCRKCKK